MFGFGKFVALSGDSLRRFIGRCPILLIAPLWGWGWSIVLFIVYLGRNEVIHVDNL
jgi:hypothetical protein